MISDDARQRKLDEETTAALVRERDRDRYWSALFAPRPNRPALLALYAFNAELDHIPALVSEPMAGQIRLQWWRDAVDFATPGARTGNPVADTLSAAIIQHNLPKDRLIGMVDARVPAMFDDAPADDKALKDCTEYGAFCSLAWAAVRWGAVRTSKNSSRLDDTMHR